MRKITNTHTGKIITDTDMRLEVLYVGDYGKKNNIKAEFLGYNKRIDEVKHQEVDITCCNTIITAWLPMSLQIL